jgi:hypothetical protein
MVSLLTVVGSATTAPAADAAADAAAGGHASRYVPISPIRVLNTRDSGFSPLLDLGILSVDPLVPEVIDAAGVDPLDVEAVAINLTIAGPKSVGYLKTWPTAEPTPPLKSASAVNNQSAGEDIANFAIVPIGTNGRISIQTRTTTDVIVDVQGVFVRSTSSQAGRFVPIATPQRALDTRNTTPVPGKTSIVVDLAGAVDEIPRTASAAVINLVATRTQEVGYLTAFPKGNPPRTSNVNYPAGGHDIAGSAITQLDNGKLTIYANGTTDVIVDVIGYMTGEADDDISSGLFVAFEPERHYDSRANKAPIGSTPLNGNSHTLQLAGSKSVPADGVLAVASNLTMTETDGGGNLVAYPKNPRPRKYSTVNAVYVGHTIANHAIVALDNGGFSIFSPRRADFIVDVSGYFLDGTTTPPTTTRRVDSPDVRQAPVSQPTLDNDFTYLQEASVQNASFGAYSRAGRRYYGWNPCKSITYAVNRQGANAAQMAALQAAIYDVEEASGFDLVYLGEAVGSLNTDSVDPRVVGGGEAMAVFGFSNASKTPTLSGGTIGIGGLGAGIDSRSAIEFAPGDDFAWIVRNGFAIADTADLPDMQELRATFAHEIGHMIGLDHVSLSARDELMRPVLTSQFTFGSGDKYGLWSIGADPCAGARLTQRALPLEPIDIDGGRWVAD